MDRLISLFQVFMREKKWWWVIFTYMLDVEISNAWRLHVLVINAENDTFLFNYPPDLSLHELVYDRQM